MEELVIIAQLIVAISVAFVWTFRFHNVLTEFESFGLNDITRNLVGVSKIALATLLITGIWYPSLVCVSAILMGGFMFVAQCFHFKIKKPPRKAFCFIFVDFYFHLNGWVLVQSS